MSIMIMIGAHRGLKAASKVMAMVISTSTKVLEETQLAMIKFFAWTKIKKEDFGEIGEIGDIEKIGEIAITERSFIIDLFNIIDESI